jgi:hypothetical protein
MATKLVQNRSTHNVKKKIHNYLKSVPSKKRRHPPIGFDIILLIVIKNNNILEL